MLSFFQDPSRLRLNEAALSVSAYAPVDVADDEVFAYLPWADGNDWFLIALNFGDRTHESV